MVVQDQVSGAVPAQIRWWRHQLPGSPGDPWTQYINRYIYLRDAQRKPDLVKPNAVLFLPRSIWASAGKLIPKWHQNRSKIERIWPRASARGTIKSTEILKNRKNGNANTQMKTKTYISLCAAISSQNGGLNGSAFTNVFLKKSDKKVV